MTQAVKYIFCFFIFYFLPLASYAQVGFCAVGDILLDRGVRTKIEEKGVYYPFEKIREIVSSSDLALFNLECPVAEKQDGYPINKKYSFRAEPGYIEGLKYAGFNIAAVANNHIRQV